MTRSNTARLAVDASVEFIYLFVLWALFVSKIERAEMYTGLAVALIGTVADQIVKQQDVISFHPKVKQLLLGFLEPYYAITGTASVFKALGRKVMGLPSEAQFRAVAYDAGGDDPQSQARRALTVAYLTIPPASVVVGIDRERGNFLVHEITRTGTPWIAKQLGALE